MQGFSWWKTRKKAKSDIEQKISESEASFCTEGSRSNRIWEKVAQFIDRGSKITENSGNRPNLACLFGYKCFMTSLVGFNFP